MSSASLTIPNDVLMYNVTLPQFTRTWQSVALIVTAAECESQGNNGLIRKVVPWSHELQFYLTNDSISVGLHVPKSPMDSEHQSAHLQLLNLANCKYRIQIGVDWTGVWAQLIRFYLPCFLPLVAAIFIDCFSQQLAAKSRRTAVPSTLACLFQISAVKMVLFPEALNMFLG